MQSSPQMELEYLMGHHLHLKNPSTLLCHRFLWWMNEPPAADTSFVSNLNMYDTCESKPRVKNGEVNWKPKEEGFLSASEAKQVWFEREVQSLRKALAKVSVPTAFHESGCWNEGFQRFEPSNPGSDPAATALAMHHGARALPGGSRDVYLRPRPEHGGSGVDALVDRAPAIASTVPGGIRAAYTCMVNILGKIGHWGTGEISMVVGLSLSTVHINAVVGLPSSTEDIDAAIGLPCCTVNIKKELGLLSMGIYLNKIGLGR